MKKQYIGCSLLLSLFLGSCQLPNQKEAMQKEFPAYEGVWTSPPMQTPSNKVPDGAITGNGDIGLVLGGTPDKQVFYFSKNDFWKAKRGYPDGGVCYIGELHLDSPVLQDASYHVEQSINDATIYSAYKKEDGTELRMKSWIAATQNRAVIELEAIKGIIPLEYAFHLGEGMESQNSQGVQNGIRWYERRFDAPDLEWPSAVAVALAGPEASVSLKPGEKITLQLAFCSNHEQQDYQTGAVQLIKENQQEDLASLYKIHLAWWRRFWQESEVTLHDEFLEKYYYGSQYLLACCSRDEAFPPGLWGTSLTMDATAGGWAGDYHLNYNHQAPWWGVYSSNHVSLSDPYDTPILEYMPNAKKHAREFLGKEGVYYPVGIGPRGFCSSMFPLTPEAMMRQYSTRDNDIEGGYMFLGQKSNAAFATANMFMRYYHTYDRTYAEKVYPFIREVAAFWEDYLTFEGGRYVSYDDNFWEVGPWEGKGWKNNYGDINPTISLGMVRMLFKGIIDMSQFLEVDQDKLDKWNHILDHLSVVPTVEIDGVTRIKACEGGTGSGSRTAPGFGRVMMHGLLFPSDVCGILTDSAFAQILRDEIYCWDTDTAAYAGTKDAHWDDLGNGFETYFTAAARVGYEGNKLLEKLKERIHKTAYPNLWITQAGGGIETLSAVPSCINEMLLQGYEGTIRLFPVWPKEKAASFRNLRTYGAFLVSSSCADGAVTQVEIESEQGRPCRLENPWGEATTCILRRENGKEETLQGRVYDIFIAKGEKVKIFPIK